MTTIGKMFVLLNLAVSMVLLSWAASLMVNRLDWVDRREGDPPTLVKGQITLLKEEIDKTSRALAEVQAGYGYQDKSVAQLDLDREERRAVYEKRLTEANNGQFHQQMLIPGQAFLNVAQQGPPVNGQNGQPLRGVRALQSDLEAAMRKAALLRSNPIDKDVPGIKELREQFQVVSREITSTDAKIDFQKDALVHLLNEERFLGDAQINWDEELRALLVRQKQLYARLKAYGVPTPTAGVGN